MRLTVGQAVQRAGHQKKSFSHFLLLGTLKRFARIYTHHPRYKKCLPNRGGLFNFTLSMRTLTRELIHRGDRHRNNFRVVFCESLGYTDRRIFKSEA